MRKKSTLKKASSARDSRPIQGTQFRYVVWIPDRAQEDVRTM